MAGNGNRELAGKVALVTGAGRLRGIGRAAAMARLGADVAVSGTGRDPATFPDDEKAVGWRDVDSVAEAIEAEGCRALALRFDVSSQEQTEAAVERIVRELGRIDILVNNAAMARGDDRTPVPELDPDLFGRVVDVKVRGLHGSTPPAMGNCRCFPTRQRSGMLPRLKAPFRGDASGLACLPPPRAGSDAIATASSLIHSPLCGEAEARPDGRDAAFPGWRTGRSRCRRRGGTRGP